MDYTARELNNRLKTFYEKTKQIDRKLDCVGSKTVQFWNNFEFCQNLDGQQTIFLPDDDGNDRVSWVLKREEKHVWQKTTFTFACNKLA